ncbi:hypothetical protein [Psychrobacter sp.]|jgi:hypothetical protein|uniref:hypothetical protein n=1 Tax=Psychrobacter TaxID=497 RepID=UPI00097F1182|nr:hypothetical protein CZ794_08190 [Psychrobacter sp. JB385]
MNLNKLVQMAIEHQQQQEASKLQHNATFELLALPLPEPFHQSNVNTNHLLL